MLELIFLETMMSSIHCFFPYMVVGWYFMILSRKRSMKIVCSVTGGIKTPRIHPMLTSWDAKSTLREPNSSITVENNLVALLRYTQHLWVVVWAFGNWHWRMLVRPSFGNYYSFIGMVKRCVCFRLTLKVELAGCWVTMFVHFFIYGFNHEEKE